MYPFGPLSQPERQPTEPEQVEPLDVEDEVSIFMKDKTLRYRAERLARAGLNPRQARALAIDRTVDKDFVIDRLLARGCPPDLAFDIASS